MEENVDLKISKIGLKKEMEKDISVLNTMLAQEGLTEDEIRK